MSNFMDFDQAWAEAHADSEEPARVQEFKLGGKTFTATMDIEAGALLAWLESPGSTQVPKLIRMYIGEEQYKDLLALGLPWRRVRPVVEFLTKDLLGNSITL